MKKIVIMALCVLINISANANTPNDNDVILACNVMKTFSELTMTLRQNGIPYSKQLEVRDSVYKGALKKDKNTAEAFRGYHTAMIKFAYYIPIFSDKTKQQQIINDFKLLIYNECLESVK